jgi:hypothetical protein
MRKIEGLFLFFLGMDWNELIIAKGERKWAKAGLKSILM